jgi:hypothetical protein
MRRSCSMKASMPESTVLRWTTHSRRPVPSCSCEGKARRPFKPFASHCSGDKLGGVMPTPAEAVTTYIIAKDGNCPFLLKQTFAEDARTRSGFANVIPINRGLARTCA